MTLKRSYRARRIVGKILAPIAIAAGLGVLAAIGWGFLAVVDITGAAIEFEGRR